MLCPKGRVGSTPTTGTWIVSRSEGPRLPTVIGVRDIAAGSSTGRYLRLIATVAAALGRVA